MRRTLAWVLVAGMSMAAGVRRSEMPLPEAPPPQRAQPLALDRVVRLHVEIDQSFVAQHGDRADEVLREAIALHNVEWRRYRREWFALAQVTFRPSDGERDASYMLAKFLERTAELPDTIHVNVVGHALEVYSSGTEAMPIGGLAYRGSDAVIISATPGVTPELLAYYLFHELGHCWDAHDIPFHGGDTTFGSKTRMTFDVDAGNEEIMEDAPGPLARATPRRAPMILREKLLRAHAETRASGLSVPLHDLLLHEPSPANPAYVTKKRALLARAGEQRPAVERILRTYEITPQNARHDAHIRHRIADHYWRANDAIRRRDYETADAELQAIRTTAAESPGVQMLVGAVERKVRKRR